MHKLWRHRSSRIGLSILAAMLLAALLGPLVLPDPQELLDVPMLPPSVDYWFGTTGQGQDVLAQTVVGARTSLLIGFVVGFSVVALGASVGTVAGYFGGWVDDVLSLLMNVFLVMPGLPLMVVIAAYLPPGAVTIAFVLVFTGWAWTARTIRAQTMALRNKDFVLAAKVAGESDLRIVLIEVLPNMMSLLLSALIGATVYAIGAQVGLEFLGLGDANQVTWGTNLYWASNDAALLTGSWWTFVPTGLSIALVGFALAMLNGAIDEINNPRLSPHKAFTQRANRAGVALTGSTPVIRGTDG